MFELNITDVWKLFSSAKEEERRAIIGWLERVVSEAKELLSFWEMKAVELSAGIITAEPLATEVKHEVKLYVLSNQALVRRLERFYKTASSVLPNLEIREEAVKCLAGILLAREAVVNALARVQAARTIAIADDELFNQFIEEERKQLADAFAHLHLWVAELDVLTENFKARIKS